jgi:hypothetical protein
MQANSNNQPITLEDVEDVTLYCICREVGTGFNIHIHYILPKRESTSPLVNADTLEFFVGDMKFKRLKNGEIKMHIPVREKIDRQTPKRYDIRLLIQFSTALIPVVPDIAPPEIDALPPDRLQAERYLDPYPNDSHEKWFERAAYVLSLLILVCGLVRKKSPMIMQS